jgi:hypothetical protein
MSNDEPMTEVFDFGAARRKWAAKFDGAKAARKKRQHQAAGSIDRRALRTTGRVEQFNFRIRGDLKVRITSAVERSGDGVAEWMERVLEAALAEAEQQEAQGS